MLNIIPHTINLIPFVEIPEVNVFGTVEEEEDTSDLQSALVASFTRSAGSPAAATVAAAAFCVFVLLYIPCMVATAAMRHEFGNRWMWAQVFFTFALAWVMAVLVFQIGTRLFI